MLCIEVMSCAVCSLCKYRHVIISLYSQGGFSKDTISTRFLWLSFSFLRMLSKKKKKKRNPDKILYHVDAKRYPLRFVWIELPVPICIYFNRWTTFYHPHTLSYLFIAHQISGSQNNLDYVLVFVCLRCGKEKKNIDETSHQSDKIHTMMEKTTVPNAKILLLNSFFSFFSSTLFVSCCRLQRYYLYHLATSFSFYELPFEKRTRSSFSQFNSFMWLLSTVYLSEFWNIDRNERQNTNSLQS